MIAGFFLVNSLTLLYLFYSAKARTTRAEQGTPLKPLRED